MIDALDEELGPHFFPDGDERQRPARLPVLRRRPARPEARQVRRLHRLLELSELPLHPAAGACGADEAPAAGGSNGVRLLGHDPTTGLPVSLRKGPYGPYVQLGEAAAAAGAADDDADAAAKPNADGTDEVAAKLSAEAAAGSSEADDPSPATGKAKRKPKAKKAKAPPPTPKPKRISLPRGLDPEALDLDKALALLALPRTLGPHPESGQTISAGLGRFGPYLRMGDTYVSLKGDDDVLSIGLNRAVDLLSQARPAKAKGKELGTHPGDGKPVRLMAGRYGPYVEHGKLRATLPAGTDAETIGLQQALDLLAEKQGRSAGKPAKAAKPAGKSAAEPAKAAPAKRPATKAKTAKASMAEAPAAKPAPRRKAGSG